MGHSRKDTQTSRKRTLSRLRKLRGSLKGAPSALDFLLQERRRERSSEEHPLKGRGSG